MSEKKIRVLIVDDSSVVRTLMRKLLSTDPAIEIVDTAPDPYVAREKLIALKPDVMTLDIEMPRMDGLTFLEKVMEHFPTRTIVISSLSAAGSQTALRALELGAVDVVEKPALDVSRSLAEMGSDLIARVKAAAQANITRRISSAPPRIDASKRPNQQAALARTTHQILAIASSTGGTEALKQILPYLPPDIPGTLIVQHLPPVFTKSYAAALQKLCPFEVREATEGDRVLPGRVLIAPGNFHMELTRCGAYYEVTLHQQPILHGVRPAADYLMNSVARIAGANSIGVVLTGMGKDGAKGLLAMKNSGSYTIAQDEATSIVFGMPREAIALGAIHSVVPLQRIAEALIARFDLKEAAQATKMADGSKGGGTSA